MKNDNKREKRMKNDMKRPVGLDFIQNSVHFWNNGSSQFKHSALPFPPTKWMLMLNSYKFT